MPDGQVTRAEFIKMLDETFGLTETTSLSFSDIKSTDWFYPYFAKAEAQGYLLNYGSYANPNGKLTREEAISLLVRYLDLPANEQGSSSYFTDYSSISENYRDYILRAVSAGLTEGSVEGGVRVFKPKSTLTRAEALTILYRAAGCIFNVNAYSRDDNAASTNNVITRGGVILNGIKLDGRVIISEGADSGTVALTGCSADTLYIRGTADVSLDDCKIKNVIVSNGCKLSLLNGTEVKNITLYGKTALGVYSGISVDVLEVGYSAANSSVTGNGTLGMVYVNASGFSSSMVPAEFRIGSGVTASFAGTQYQGSSDAQESFSVTPFVTSDSSNYYLNLFPAIDGKVYYYYTNGAGIPSTADYDSYHNASSYSGVISVSEGESKTEATYSASAVKNFDYVVLQLQADGRKYAPVLIPNTNTDGTGFSTAPYLADETTVKFMAAEAGTLYWFYAESGEKMTQMEFLKKYTAADSALRSSNDIVSGRTLSISLSSKYLKNYKYVVLMLKNAAGSYYTPVVVSAGDNGFVSGPSLKNVGTVEFKTSVAGELYYYFAEEADLPAADDYKAEYNRADHNEHFSVKKNTASSFEYASSRSDDYPYLIIAIKSSDGTWMQPVALNIDFDTGFKELPEVYDDTLIKFKTSDEGEVMYYYTKNAAVPTAAGFKSAYSAAGKNDKDTVDVDNEWDKITYSQTKAANYPYMAFMFVDEDGHEYTPVLIELNATANTGFKITPYVVGDTVYFTTLENGEVWYYYTRTDDVVAMSEFEEEYDDAREYGYKSTTAGKLTGFEVADEDVLEDYPYLVLSFLPEEYENQSEKKFCYPVILEVEKAGSTGTAIRVDSITEDEVWITTGVDGRVYYYFTDSPTNPGTKFESKHDSADGRSKSCDENEEIRILTDDIEELYLVLCIAVSDGSDEVFLSPVVVDLANRTSGGTSSDGSTTNAAGLSVTGHDMRNHEITFTALESGDVTVTMAAGQFKTTCGTVTVKKNQEYTFNYDSFVNSAIIDFIIQNDGSGVAITLQLVSSDGKEIYRSISFDVIE